MMPQDAVLQQLLTSFAQACREAGIKVTQQRLEIFRELALATDHPSAEILHKRLLTRLPTMSMDTVYRTLFTLEKYGLVRKIQTSESQARFEAAVRQHHHFICDNCREIIDFHWSSFDDAELPEEAGKWGRIKNRNAVIQGTCSRCLAGSE